MDRLRRGRGFIAALDQSGGSTPKTLVNYGIPPSAWSSEEEMFGHIHAMRCRILTSPAFTSAVGGYTRQKACEELARNEGMIASFSRALLSDLRVSMSDAQFDATLATAIDEIFRASVHSDTDASSTEA
jgi:fructose-bisphosphate aldolase class 1